MGKDDARLLTIASSRAKDLALLKRPRAGRRVSDLAGGMSVREWSRTGPAKARSPLLAQAAQNAAVALWTTSKMGSD
jgi:hypothetical protein